MEDKTRHLLQSTVMQDRPKLKRRGKIFVTIAMFPVAQESQSKSNENSDGCANSTEPEPRNNVSGRFECGVQMNLLSEPWLSGWPAFREYLRIKRTR